MPKSPARSGNRLLSRLSRADFALLKPHLEPVELPILKTLETDKSRIDTVYFIDHGFASVVANGPGKCDIEVGIIGREGMTGLAVVLGQNRARHTTYIQVAGAGQRISVAKGVERPAVSVAVKALERKCLISPGRRVITILDRKGLVSLSNGAYVRPDGQ
jgi:hypothetical protein